MNTSVWGQSNWATRQVKETYLHTSPYLGPADFSVLDTHRPHGDAMDHVSLADLLRNGFVYPPHTIFRDVKNLVTGFDFQRGMEIEPRFRFAYHSAAATSRPPSKAISDEALLRTYHQLLTHAVQKCTADMAAPWILQSGGKDSTSLAIAIADARPDITCLTY